MDNVDLVFMRNTPKLVNGHEAHSDQTVTGFRCSAQRLPECANVLMLDTHSQACSVIYGSMQFSTVVHHRYQASNNNSVA